MSGAARTAAQGQPAGRTPRWSRRRVVLLGLLLGGAGLATSALTWVTATTSSALESEVPIAVTGSVAAPAVAAGSLVVVAAALALSIGGRVGRVAAALGMVLGGVLTLGSAVAAVGDPEATAISAARGAVGVAVLDSAARLTPAPWVAGVVGLLTVALGAVALLLARSWGTPGERYDRASAPEADAGASPRTAEDDGAHETGAQDDGRAPEADERDAWDALSRGEDPT